jgi:hypothetical protein
MPFASLIAKFVIVLHRARGNEWRIEFEGREESPSGEVLGLDAYPDLSPLWYYDSEGSYVRDDGKPSGLYNCPDGVGTFVRAAEKAGGKVYVEIV